MHCNHVLKGKHKTEIFTIAMEQTIAPATGDLPHSNWIKESQECESSAAVTFI